MQLNPSVMFAGQCEEAFRFYASVLGGEISMLAYGDSPMASLVPPDWQRKIAHASLVIGDTRLTGNDQVEVAYQRPAGFSILLGPAEPAEAERIFQALADGGVVKMPMQQTFWSVRYGAFTDRFGIPWEINCAQAPDSAATPA
jgi:PhnB protein